MSWLFAVVTFLVVSFAPSAHAALTLTGFSSDLNTQHSNWRWERKLYWREGATLFEGDCPRGIDAAHAEPAHCRLDATEMPWTQALAALRTYVQGRNVVTVEEEQELEQRYESLLAEEQAVLSGKNVGDGTVPPNELSQALGTAAREWRMALEWRRFTDELTAAIDGTSRSPFSVDLQEAKRFLPTLFNQYRLEQRRRGVLLGRLARVRARQAFVVKDLRTRNSWKPLADDVARLGTASGEWVRWDVAAGTQALEGQQGETSCAGVYGKGWHLPAYDDVMRAKKSLEASALGNALGRAWIWTSDLAPRGIESTPAKYYVVRLHKSWTEWRYGELGGADRAVALCVCGPAVKDAQWRVSASECARGQD